MLSGLVDAETGQRGFILTDKEPYLVPYNAALSRVWADYDRDVYEPQDDHQRDQFARLKQMIEAKLAELNRTISVRRQEGFAAALPIVETDEGKHLMDGIRVLADAIVEDSHKAGEIQEARVRTSAAVLRWLSVLGSGG